MTIGISSIMLEGLKLRADELVKKEKIEQKMEKNTKCFERIAGKGKQKQKQLELKSEEKRIKMEAEERR